MSYQYLVPPYNKDNMDQEIVDMRNFAKVRRDLIADARELVERMEIVASNEDLRDAAGLAYALREKTMGKMSWYYSNVEKKTTK